MAKAPYKLSAVLLGHAADVRAIASFADGTIVSASRDKTARVWKPTGQSAKNEYTETAVLRGHGNFVSAVCVLEPSEKYPKGLIITGSNDSTICIYERDHLEPMHVIIAHQNTVCNLQRGKQAGMYLSSSWDSTAKLWNIVEPEKPLLILKGHSAAVWCVADLDTGDIVTGSADTSVLVWMRNASVKHKLDGHTDCVRDIAIVKRDEFITCANDATIKHWNASSGTCLGTYYGHENYIYSLSFAENSLYVFSASEDRTVRVWYNGEVEQTITLPAKSVWCVRSLPNGDIVCGSSDGAIRIFSADTERYANADILQCFEKELDKVSAEAQQKIGGIDIKDLPDKRALQQPGQRDGQTLMIKEGNVVNAYSWSVDQRKWLLVGNVMGASGGSALTSGKQLYNGIEYDYVFSVDIQDGVPPLKLPYNNGQDPWLVAQKFLQDNDLSPLFLDQVANFIIKNSQPAPTSNVRNASYVDPFTGGSRYIPSSKDENSSQPPSVLSKEDQVYMMKHIDVSNNSPSYIPHTTYLKSEQANTSAIKAKLRELNEQQYTAKITERELDIVMELTNKEISDENLCEAVVILKQLLDWPDDVVFPALDVARLAVLHREVNELMESNDLMKVIRRYLRQDANTVNQMLTFRLIVNLFSHERGEQLCLLNKTEIIDDLYTLDCASNKQHQIGLSTCFVNFAVVLSKQNDREGKRKLLKLMFKMVPHLTESEALFRSFVALGTLLLCASTSEERNEMISTMHQSEAILNLLKTISTSKDSTETKLSAENKLITCSRQVVCVIQNSGRISKSE